MFGSSLKAWTGKQRTPNYARTYRIRQQTNDKLYHSLDVKGRIAEIRCEGHSRALMGINEKRDLLRQMLEGTVPTKANKRRDGTVEAVFDMLGALVAGAKMAGEFDGTAVEQEPKIKLKFGVYHRPPPNPPRDWLKRIGEVEGTVDEDRC